MESIVTLRFSSYVDLWRFKEEVKPVILELNHETKTLQLRCNKEQLELATRQYWAKLLDNVDS
jgi:hypothetical protein